jgi:hypothetical protein
VQVSLSLSVSQSSETVKLVMSPVGPRTKNNCAGEVQQQFSSQSVDLVSFHHKLAVRQSPAGKDVNTEDEESALLGAVRYQRLVKAN